MVERNEYKPRPIGDVLPGVKIAPLPAGHEAVTVYVLIKTRSNGSESEFDWSWRSPEIQNQEELLGALLSQSDLLRQQMLSRWED